jgi:hypothetical protein
MGVRRIDRTKVVAAAVALAAVTALAAACAPPTSPKPAPLIECEQVAGGITYTPPATTTPQDVTIATEPGFELRNCSDRTGGTITSGELDIAVLFADWGCEPLTTGQPLGEGGGSIRWSDGSTSTVSAQAFGGSGGSFISELTITGGRFAGSSGSVATFVTSAVGSCATGVGVTNAFLASDDPLAFVAAVAPILPPRTDLATVDTGQGGTTCSVRTDRTVSCWGDNSDGELGNPLFAPGSSTSLALPVPGLTNVEQVSVGGDHVCVLRGTGAVRCWGDNDHGQLGNGNTVDSTLPVAPLGLVDVQQISAGGDGTCALLADDTVRCWGAGAGTGGVDDPTPVAVNGLSDVTQLTSGSWYHCALLGDGSLRCWGSNHFGQLGNGTTVDSYLPVPVAGTLPPVVQVSAGAEHTCALDAAGEVWCWGFNRYGQLGQGSPSEEPLTRPSRVIPTLAATAIDAGGATTCALVVGGSVSCWGDNTSGQLGTGTTTPAARPTLVLGLRNATSVSGSGTACATLPGGRVDCWGNGRSGELGNGRTTNSAVPVAVIDP